MRLERNELEVFAAVVESGGFLKASERLGRSQSAVSQAVASLENKLGSRLLQRGRSSQLSRVGRRVYEYAQQTLNGERHLLAEVSTLLAAEKIPLSLAMNNFVSRYFAAQLLGELAAQQPSLQLTVRVMSSRQIISSVLSGEAELGFGPFQTHMQAFNTIGLLQVRHHLVVAESHPQFHAIMDGNQRALASSCLLASYLDEPSKRPGQQRIRDFFTSVWQVNSLALRLKLISQGLGVGYFNAPTLAAETATLRLHEVASAQFASFHREVGLFHQREKSLSPGAKSLVEQCRKHWPDGAATGPTSNLPFDR